MESSLDLLVRLQREFRKNRNKRYYNANATTIRKARVQRYAADLDASRQYERTCKQAQKAARLKQRLAAV